MEQQHARSGKTILEPESLTVFSAGAHHGKCSNKRHESEEETQQIVVLLTDALLQEAAEAALVRGSRIRLDENRNFRDVQLERLLWALHDEHLLKSSVSHLFGDMLSSAIAI